MQMKKKMYKRLLAFGLAVLMGIGIVVPSIHDLTYAKSANSQAGGNKFWNKERRPYPGDYYGKTGRDYFGYLKVDGKAAVCLDASKSLHTGKTGDINVYNFDGSSNFPTGISREGAELMGYAILLGGGGNGKEITDLNFYIITQTICWMAESKGGNVTWEDLEEWRNETYKLSDYFKAPYNTTVKNSIDYYLKEVTRQVRPEAVASFMSKYPSEAPTLTLNYDEDTGIYSNDFELIDYGEATAAGFDQVWMQYFLDYDAAVAKLEAEGKIDKNTLKMEHKAEGTRNWVHVEYTGDIEKLKSCGPIPLHFKEGTDGAKYTQSLQSLSIWTPDDPSQQHLLADATSEDWTVYMTFGNMPIPDTPSTSTGEGSYTVTVNTHKHEETFVSNYNIDLYKYDYETGKPLANSEFEILEKMDTSQFDDSVDHNGGNPNGTYPLDDLNFDKFSQVKYDTKKPTDDWEVCGTFTTDENGHINHKDVFNYDFTATYCDGHPDPEIEYIECDHEEGEDCDCEEKNAQLEEEAWEAWQKAVDECAARTNFHSINKGEGKQACEEYRNHVWNSFINLDYQYTAREKTARSGYILHDIHVDDNPVETVKFDASEAHDSGDYSTATGKFKGNIDKRKEGNGIVYDSVMAAKTVSSYTMSNNERESQMSLKPISLLKSSGNEFENLNAPEEMEEVDEWMENEEDMETATPSNATVLEFEPIGGIFTHEFSYAREDSGGGDLHCTWNGSEWAFNGDPEPEFTNSEIEEINQDDYEHDLIAHVFYVYDHRTEGEIHINKRDLDLENDENDNYGSYADANGDGDLEGAVYGLFAAEDIVHPDGKTGVVFKAGDLVSIATTDRNGDASFMAITEATDTSKSKDNLYTQDITTELINNGINIDERIYQNNLHNNMNGWIGRPLILGRYYVKELSRSEGYELSVNGINKTITNFGATEDTAFENTGTVRFNGYKPDDQYGDDQDHMIRFDIAYKNTDGYSITVKGYPEGTKFYKEKAIKRKENQEIVTGKHIEITDIPILAEEGEYVLDENGSKIVLTDSQGNIIYDTTAKQGTFYPAKRSSSYPNGTAKPTDQTKYESSNIDIDYLKSETQNILKQIGYTMPNKAGKDKMPWMTINVSGATNGEIIENIINELRKNSFYDSFVIDKITKNKNDYSVIVRYGYLEKSATSYIDEQGNLYLKRTCTNILEDDSSVKGYYFVVYTPDEYTVNGNGYTVDLQQIDGDAVYGNDYRLKKLYDPLYKTYAKGEQKYGMMRQEDGSFKYGLLFETREVEDKETIEVEVDDFELTELQAKYKDGVYNIHIDTSDVDWANKDEQFQSFRIVIPEDANKDQIKQNSTILVSPELQEIESGSYVRYKTLPYNSQNDIYSGDETRIEPIGVLERPIRQKVKVIKDIQTNEDGSYAHDTYSDVHEENLSEGNGGWLNKTKDWLASLLGKEVKDQDTTKIPDFRFKVYLKSNLERLYRNEDGNVVWLDRNGNALTPQYQDTNNDGNYDTFTWVKTNQDGTGESVIDFPEIDKTENNSILSSNVQKIYTEVDHNTDSTTTGDISNNVWAEYADPQTGEMTNAGELRGDNTSQDGENGEAIYSNGALYSYKGKNTNVKKTDRINENQNNGYTRLLETSVETVEDGAGTTRDIEQYNYEKFFDAIAAANEDKWDNDMHTTYTGTEMKNYPGQYWFETFYEKYQKDDADSDHTLANTDGNGPDGTAGGDRDTSFKPFQWIRENLFGNSFDSDSEYPTVHDNPNIENSANTSDYARANAQASDSVRQFAIDWYLKDEVAKLVVNNGHDEDVALDSTDNNYSEGLYDHALFEAIAKAYNYLKPFYQYDLDTIYSISWDSDTNGGTDNDNTTLSADMLYENAGTDEQSKSGYYYGVSSYLPYGTYILVEQQPYRDDLGDFNNKHYEIDKPKEISLPAVYEENGNLSSPEKLNGFYNYNSSDTPEELVKKYNIRFNEEWADNHTDDLRKYVIRAHNNDGDYEIYKYGLDVGKLTNTIIYDVGTYQYAGYNVTQSISDPLKDYYNNPLVDKPENGGNQDSHYYGDDKNKGVITVNGSTYTEDAIEKRYHYGSISENAGTANDVLYPNRSDKDDNNSSGFYVKDNVKTMSGNQTAYEGKYTSALVPWSVIEPDDSVKYDITNYKGYADSKFRNIFYTTKLRIEKLDSETGENILHDGAIFGLYAASRYTTQEEVDEAIANGAPETTKIGNVKYYLKDTTITGTYEFLKAMGADNIKPYTRMFGEETNQYSGTVPAGTPVCLESEQIILYDETGTKTGDMTVYTTTNDVNMMEEETDLKSYHDQNTGYFVTPQPIGAGVYVLAELKPPTGYSRTKPIAIEVYSDAVTYYINGSMDSQVKATIYTDNLINQDE